MSEKYGSFNVKINDETVSVSPLNQLQLSKGWQLVVPRPRKVKVEHNGRTLYRRNYKVFKVNLSQLPSHLWWKLRKVYENGIYSYSYVKDNMYKYIVQPTNVDDEIRQLCDELPFNIYFEENISRIKQLLDLMDKNNVNGWVVLRTKYLLHKLHNLN
jgi:hypothetical protein